MDNLPTDFDLQNWLPLQLSRLSEGGLPPADVRAPFSDLGLESVDYLNLSILIDERFGVAVTAREIFLNSNVEALSQFVLSVASAGRETRTLLPQGFADYTPVSTGGAAAPLFWLNGYEFLEFSDEHLPENRRIYYLHHQGSDGTRAKHRSIEKMAKFYLQTLITLEPTGPYCLGGYSIGGTIAYEMAQQLRAAGQKVDTLLLLSPAGAPKRRREALLRFERRRMMGKSLLGRSIHALRLRIGLVVRWSILKVRDVRFSVKCYTYFVTGRRLPTRLIWDHLWPIYKRASRKYKILSYPGDTIIAHESTLPVEEWTEKLSGSCEVLPPIAVEHLELMRAKSTDPWVKAFVAPIADG